MKVLVHHAVYKPEPIGNGTYTSELCEWLVRQGHEVTVVCPPPYYPHWRVFPGYSAWKYTREILEGVSVFRCPIFIPSDLGGLKRLLYAVSFVIFSFPVMARMIFWCPDVVFVVEPNFPNTLNALLVGKLTRAISWLQIQDFEIDIALAMGVARSRLMVSLSHGIESFVMRRFDVVSTISRHMLTHLKEKRVDPVRCRLFPNWVDTNEIFPQAMSPMRESLGIRNDVVVALFSGTMGAKQGVEVIVEAARSLRDRSDIEFIICGDGGAAEDLKVLAAGLSNVRFLPLQPLSKLNDLLSVADIHLLPQKTTAQDLVMPSKLLGMAASGRPVIATVNAGTEVADSLETFGIVTPPGDSGALAAAIVSLAGDRAERERLGYAAREFAIANLSKSGILARFEKELLRLAGRSALTDEKNQGAERI